jgi:hypothetical protein
MRSKYKKISKISKKNLIKLFNYYRDIISGVLPIAWGEWELEQLRVIEMELDRREK